MSECGVARRNYSIFFNKISRFLCKNPTFLLKRFENPAFYETKSDSADTNTLHVFFLFIDDNICLHRRNGIGKLVIYIIATEVRLACY